jgi:putative protease
LNRLRRELVAALDAAPPSAAPALDARPCLSLLLDNIKPADADREPAGGGSLSALCRSGEQIDAALECGIRRVCLDFEDLRRYRDAVARLRAVDAGVEIFLATPRIQKAGEQGFFQLIASAAPDGVLIRNLGALSWFKDSPLRKAGDFSLNVANPLTAALLMREGLDWLTVSYDLDAEQVAELLAAAPPAWFELTLHQHLPMFHMEHCLFAAFLSGGKDFKTCGRPCDRHEVKLKDRINAEHPVKADVGCRNTVFHQRAQSGVAFHENFHKAGLRRYRLEFLNETAAETRAIISVYQQFLAGQCTAGDALARLKAQNQLGITGGTLTVL